VRKGADEPSDEALLLKTIIAASSTPKRLSPTINPEVNARC